MSWGFCEIPGGARGQCFNIFCSTIACRGAYFVSFHRSSFLLDLCLLCCSLLGIQSAVSSRWLLVQFSWGHQILSTATRRFVFWNVPGCLFLGRWWVELHSWQLLCDLGLARSRILPGLDRMDFAVDFAFNGAVISIQSIPSLAGCLTWTCRFCCNFRVLHCRGLAASFGVDWFRQTSCLVDSGNDLVMAGTPHESAVYRPESAFNSCEIQNPTALCPRCPLQQLRPCAHVCILCSGGFELRMMLDDELNRLHQLTQKTASFSYCACNMEAAAHLSPNRTVLAHAAFWCRLSLQSALAAMVWFFCRVGWRWKLASWLIWAQSWVWRCP